MTSRIDCYGHPCSPERIVETAFGNADWEDVWGRLHHQGNVTDASYAAVVAVARLAAADALWPDPALFVSVVETSRHNPKNPPLPSDIGESYMAALKRMREFALSALSGDCDRRVTSVLLSLVAATSGMPAVAEFALLEDDEQSELLNS